MFFRRIKSHGIAHNSYLFAHGGEAAIVDPRRDIDVYLELLRARGDRLRFILETHRNEDYVIGSTALEAATGAEILHSRHLDFGYGKPIADGDDIGIGQVAIRALETQGHTDDSLSFVITDTDAGDAPVMVCTGDALFVGDTGRIDLYGEDEAPRMARALHASIFDKLLPLGDGTILLPSHGGGSVCGGEISERDESTLGHERLTNPKLERDRDRFVAMKLAEQHERPPYFLRMEEWNRKGDAPIYERLPRLCPLRADEIAARMGRGAVIDLRMPQAFAGGHIPGSYNLWHGGLADYLGWIVPHGKTLFFVLDRESDADDVMRTALRLGFDEVGGYLSGGFEAWQNEGREVERFGTIDTVDLAKARERYHILDVRKPAEVKEGTLKGAQAIFVGELEKRVREVPRDRPVVTMCSVGHRAGIAASILARHGHPKVFNYLGGYTAWCRTHRSR
jgi:hydroxyacylglutathione hydrolase